MALACLRAHAWASPEHDRGFEAREFDDTDQGGTGTDPQERDEHNEKQLPRFHKGSPPLLAERRPNPVARPMPIP